MTGQLTYVRVAEADRLGEWSLVLQARGIAHWLGPLLAAEPPAEPTVWGMAVDARDALLAAAELDAYDAEARALPAIPRDVAPRVSRALGVAVAAALLAAYAWMGGREAPSTWLAHGSAVAERIVHGELWRALTALSLHADLAHVLGNAAALAVLLPTLAARVGAGLAAWIAVGSGFFGNLATAWVTSAWLHQRHDSIGASTSVFGLLGALAALAFLLDHAQARRRVAVVAATLGLFGLVGVSERADVFAHGFGLLAGVSLGVITAALPARARQMRPWGGAVLALGAAGTLVLAWVRALA